MTRDGRNLPRQAQRKHVLLLSTQIRRHLSDGESLQKLQSQTVSGSVKHCETLTGDFKGGLTDLKVSSDGPVGWMLWPGRQFELIAEPLRDMFSDAILQAPFCPTHVPATAGAHEWINQLRVGLDRQAILRGSNRYPLGIGDDTGLGCRVNLEALAQGTMGKRCCLSPKQNKTQNKYLSDKIHKTR